MLFHTCAIHAVQRGNIGLNDVVVIAGCGSLGLGMVAAARLKNPRLLVAIDLMDYRLDIARACGADVCFNPEKVNVIEEINKLTDGLGCDVYIEATGHPDAVEQGLHSVRKLGTFVEFGLFKEPVTVDWTIIGDSKELNVLGSHLSPYCYPIAINMLEKGQVPVEKIVTHTLQLADFEKGFQMVKDPRAEKSVKVALTP
ncbi:MAG: erythritol/L-threitol dehydrogenase [Halanaerobiales bacterium]|nr:erythritol/L-threitol dehydrogenase [Halanaerobiales bacterium]